MVEILAHRGWWKDPEEANSGVAFERCFSNGFGCELDVRDFGGSLVVSHDPPADKELGFETVLRTYKNTAVDRTIAINIKSDGLQDLLRETLDRAEIQNFFVFDMSVPDTRQCIAAGLPVFTRHSEFEPEPVFYDTAAGVWVDCFESDWIDSAVIEGHLKAGKKVALVSPELHRRDPEPVWESWRETCMSVKGNNVLLCTDYPNRADEFFNA